MRISRKQYESVCGLDCDYKFIKNFLVYDLTCIKDECIYILKTSLCLPVYILITVPLHVLKFFMCMWDGGLHEFSFEGPYVRRDVIFPGDRIWKQIDEIWHNSN